MHIGGQLAARHGWRHGRALRHDTAIPNETEYDAEQKLRPQGRQTRPMLARLARHGTEHTGTFAGIVKGRQDTAAAAWLAQHDAYTGHNWHAKSWHGTAKDAASLATGVRS